LIIYKPSCDVVVEIIREYVKKILKVSFVYQRIG
jgi:hypothetical protein